MNFQTLVLGSTIARKRRVTIWYRQIQCWDKKRLH